MLTRRKKKYSLVQGSEQIDQFGLVVISANEGNDYMIAVTDDPEKFKNEYIDKGITISRNIKSGWLSCIDKEIFEAKVDEFYNMVTDVVIPMYQDNQISKKNAICIARDIMNYREANVLHYGNEFESTDYYNAYKFLNSYRDMINKMLVYAAPDGRGSKDHNKFIDTAWKYLKQKENNDGNS